MKKDNLIRLETYAKWNPADGDEPENWGDENLMMFQMSPENLVMALKETEWDYDFFVNYWTWDMAGVIYSVGQEKGMIVSITVQERESSITEKMNPNEFVEAVLVEVERLCVEVRNEKTGSALQRGLFEELEDCASVLCNPDDLKELQSTTTNELLYGEMKPIDWSA
jgi:hypothetical protein